MRAVRIGILDVEKEYVESLAAYLARMGKGQWRTAAFTDWEILNAHLEYKQLDILAGTNQEELLHLQKMYKEISLLWLSEQEESRGYDMGISAVYRYQSAQAIGKAIQNIVEQMRIAVEMARPMVAIYSPVGRCGKTSLAMEVVKNDAYGEWLYIGMEDYSCFRMEKDNQIGEVSLDEILYHWKERQEEKLLALVEQSAGVIGTGSSVFDMRLVDEKDIIWLREVLFQSRFCGIVFDIGTGVLKDYEIFAQFDTLVVPYLLEEPALIKKENFERLLDLYGLEEIKDKIQFINMENQQEIITKTDEIFRRKIL